MKITLNCDMGESFGLWRFGSDDEIMPHVDCANIACGFHASDPLTMSRTVEMAVAQQKAIGAHPSLPDREGFGRREMRLSVAELTSAFIYQIGALEGFLKAHSVRLSHVKLHGIVYGMAAREIDIAIAIAEAVKVFGVPLFGMPGTEHERAAAKVGVAFVGEFFADLGYGSRGELIIPRTQSAVDVPKAITRLRRALESGKVDAIDGTVLDISFGTVCIHSDPPNSAEVAAAMRSVIDAQSAFFWV